MPTWPPTCRADRRSGRSGGSRSGRSTPIGRRRRRRPRVRPGSGPAAAAPARAAWTWRPTPELLAALDAAAAGRRRPDVDVAARRPPTAGRVPPAASSSGRAAAALAIGLALVVLDTVPHAARPVPRPARHRPRRRASTTNARCGSPPAVLPARRARSTGSSRGRYTRRHRPHRRAAALRPAHPDLRPPAAAVARLLRPRARRPDHDPHDHRRRGAVAAGADRADHRGRQRPHLRRRVRVPGHPVAAAGAGRRVGAAAAARSRRGGTAPLGARLRTGPRLDRRRQRQPPGEPVGRARRPGLRRARTATSAASAT